MHWQHGLCIKTHLIQAVCRSCSYPQCPDSMVCATERIYAKICRSCFSPQCTDSIVCAKKTILFKQFTGPALPHNALTAWSVHQNPFNSSSLWVLLFLTIHWQHGLCNKPHFVQAVYRSCSYSQCTDSIVCATKPILCKKKIGPAHTHNALTAWSVQQNAFYAKICRSCSSSQCPDSMVCASKPIRFKQFVEPALPHNALTAWSVHKNPFDSSSLWVLLIPTMHWQHGLCINTHLIQAVCVSCSYPQFPDSMVCVTERILCKHLWVLPFLTMPWQHGLCNKTHVCKQFVGPALPYNALTAWSVQQNPFCSSSLQVLFFLTMHWQHGLCNKTHFMQAVCGSCSSSQCTDSMVCATKRMIPARNTVRLMWDRRPIELANPAFKHSSPCSSRCSSNLW